ncbi:transcription initiation factor TFIIIB [Paenibacillus sp. N1-5-1-14]|nr:transcription initiation factor TFIIIB [Paenibacillus radicibacter]
MTCPKCGGQDIVKGIQSGYANVFPEAGIFKMGSEIVHVLCASCGFIIESYVKKPEKFKGK